MNTKDYQHESYGQISFSRVNGIGTKFYGSELPQDNFISMEIHHSELSRDITTDRYYNTGPLITRLRMSSNQFSELITSLNYRSGVPCTLEFYDG